MKLVKLITLAAIVILLLVISGAGPAETPGTPTLALSVEGDIIVTSTADSGPGTLRQALLDAQSGDTITFDPAVFPPSNPATIYLTTILPVIRQGNLKIDASNAGVILDGSKIINTSGDWISGLEIKSDWNIVQGLQIINFSPGTGIALGGGAQYNTIGGDRSVGSGPLGQGNLVSKVDTGIGLFGDNTSFNTITGNLIGTDPTGTDAWGINGIGVHILEGAIHNIIGPDNIIAYSDTCGIGIQGSNSLSNVITQNSIHGNTEGGICLAEGGNNNLPAPVILDFDLAAGIVTGFSGANYTIEIFSDSGNEGEFYEGQTTTDGSGFFIFNKGTSLAGPHLTATATDATGNTSGFSAVTSSTYGATPLQEGSNLPRAMLQPKRSPELEDNRIGIQFCDLWKLGPEVFPHGVLDASYILSEGVKWARFAINHLDSDRVHWDKPENVIDPAHDGFITSLADNGITMTYVLSFWDKEYVAQGGEVQSPRFKTEDEIQRYLDFVRFIVRHFKDRIEYYEIWNEPNVRGEGLVQWIEVEDYINLVKRAVPVIREEYPEAKIVVGGVGYLLESDCRDYLFAILRSDIMPLVDVVSWHGMYNTSPEHEFQRDYYYEYPSIVQEIKEVASDHGFEGEYVVDELHWSPSGCSSYWPPGSYSETKCAKYFARGILMNLGMDVRVSQFYCVPGEHPLQIVQTIRNLCTVMAGAEPVDLPLEIHRGAESGFGCQLACNHANNVRHYCFSLPNGERLIALWIDGEAVDNYAGINTTVTIPGFSAQRVMGIDVLHGFEQELLTSMEDGNLVIENLLVKDYPIILRLIP